MRIDLRLNQNPLQPGRWGFVIARQAERGIGRSTELIRWVLWQEVVGMVVSHLSILTCIYIDLCLLHLPEYTDLTA
jgi:short subunit dehydrogenase-like uncharacterized protein